MVGRRVVVRYRSGLLPGRPVLEDEFRCVGFRRTLEANEERDELIQFYAEQGGLRTVRRKDIVRLR